VQYKEQFKRKIEQLNKDHSREIKQLNRKIEQLNRKIEQLNKEHGGERKCSSASAMEVTPQPLGSSLVMATTTSPLNSFGCAQKHTGDTELDDGEEEPNASEEEPQAKKTRTEDEEHDE
jgi:TolA-binding protein